MSGTIRSRPDAEFILFETGINVEDDPFISQGFHSRGRVRHAEAENAVFVRHEIRDRRDAQHGSASFKDCGEPIFANELQSEHISIERQRPRTIALANHNQRRRSFENAHVRSFPVCPGSYPTAWQLEKVQRTSINCSTVT